MATWKNDPDHSHLGFVVKHLMITEINGRFADLSITVQPGGADGLSGAVFSMARFLGSGPIENDDAKVIVTEFNGVCTGFLVSGVNRIYRLSWTDVEAPGQFLQNVSRSSVTGVVRLEERVIFLLDLEAIVAELHPAMAIRFDASDMAHSGEKTYNILHVDDSSSIRSLLLDLLNKEGRFTVTQKVNGQDAWTYLEGLRNRCEAEDRPISDFVQGVITDIEMPGMLAEGLRLMPPESKVMPLPTSTRGLSCSCPSGACSRITRRGACGACGRPHAAHSGSSSAAAPGRAAG